MSGVKVWGRGSGSGGGLRSGEGVRWSVGFSGREVGDK